MSIPTSGTYHVLIIFSVREERICFLSEIGVRRVHISTEHSCKTTRVSKAVSGTPRAEENYSPYKLSLDVLLLDRVNHKLS